MFCTQCGTQLPADAKFCPACGAGQDAAAPAAKRSRPFVLAAAGGLVVIAAAGAYALYAPGLADKRAEKPKEIKQAAVPAAVPAGVPADTPAPAAAPVPTPPAPAGDGQAPDPKTFEQPAAAGGPDRAPDASGPAPDPAEISAAHEALDRKIAEEEDAAKKRALKR